MLPGREVPRPSLRRSLLHRGTHDRDLLPPVLPGPDAGVPQRHLPPERGVRAGRRLPRLQALPARRHPGQPRLGRRRDRGRPRDAADRRRCRRPRGRRRAGPPGRLHAAASHPTAHVRARRRPPRPCPGASRADRAGARRDDRPGLRRRRVRGRLLQRPAVQRHRPRGLRRDTDRAARASPRDAGPGDGDDAARRTHAVRGPRAARLPRLPRRAGGRGRRPGLVCPHPRPPARPRHGPARARRRRRERADRVREGGVPAARPARHRGGGRARPPPGRRRLRPDGGRRPVPR